MAMGRSFKIFHNPGQNQYALVLEQRGKSDYLLFENYAATLISPQEYEATRKTFSKLTDAFGCLGILRFNAAEHIVYYLICITGCSSVGKIGNSEIYRISNVSMLSMRGNSADEEKVSDIKKLLCCGTFYFSWCFKGEKSDAFDLTLAEQKKAKHSEGKMETENRFFWNRMFHIPILRNGIEVNDWLLKVMCGSVEIRTVYVGSKQAKAVVISRLSSERAGTRFHVRGVNDMGHVANFCESEQAIFIDEEVTSFIQIRGSVPLFWEQPGVNVGSHKIKMSRGPELSAPAFDAHMKLLKQNYGNQIIINLLGSSLVGSKEGEATLSTAFQTHHKACPQHLDIPHILFDYHAEVKNGTDKNLAKLRSKVQKYMQKFDFFTMKKDEITREQYGTVRTNCTDCLDRTNCVQTYFGILVLEYQLMDLGLTDKTNIVSRFEEMFKQMWISNGNELSKMYAGTGALQGGSKFIDGARSAARTIQNNLLDSTKQEAIDVLLFGSSFNSEIADKARVLLPPQYVTAPRSVLNHLIKGYDEYTEPVPLRVAVGTYNINGGKHFRSIVYKDVSLSDWLLDAHKTEKMHALVDLSTSPTDETKPIDIFAIGFEEMVDLDAKNIVNTSSENAKAWSSELNKILNRDEKYTLVTFQQLVGVCLYVFVRPKHAQFIRDVSVDSVKTGMGGTTGNKGAVAIRFLFHATSMCFVCSHFAAGQNNISDRNNDYAEAVKKIAFPMGRTLMNHDYIFWCGDFNYRINLGREETKGLIAQEEWETLLEYDQLNIEREGENVFHGFMEGDIKFAPTYKYDLFSDDYDTSEKCRVPAWTDRVLWKRRQISDLKPKHPGIIHWYGRSELKQSDHRPILAVIDVEVEQIDSKKRLNLFNDSLKLVGPPDGSILLQFENVVSLDIHSILDDHFMECLKESMNEIGPVRFLKFIHEMIWVGFMDHEKALVADRIGIVQVCGHDLTIRLRCPNWEDVLANELKLCSDNTYPLCGDKELNLKRESARLLSQLSKLSFEELEALTMIPSNSTPPPQKPPPPRPLPPSRPPPPSRPDAPPSRPLRPPSKAARPERSSPPSAKGSPIPPRKPPPPTLKDTKKENSEDGSTDNKSGDGFMDIFTVTSPLEQDIPASSPSDSLGDDSSKKDSKLSSNGSLEYPDGYDPLAESSKSWDKGVEQTIPSSAVLPSLPKRQNSSGKSTPTTGPSTPKRELPPVPKRGPSLPPPSGRPPPLPPMSNRGPPPPLPKR
uniref:phosphoinositide 5-phosphatase n=1 Tax=Lepeophtheirus salmonis TaxID=72036 RepID=A0A0K2U5M9_LEPSM